MNAVKRSIAIVFALMVILTSGCRQYEKSVIVSSNSFFDRMIISNDHVYMICYVEFVNDSNLKKTFSVRGESAEDVKNGLLNSIGLEFFLLETEDPSSISEENVEQMIRQSDSIKVEPHSTVKYYVCFAGEHGREDSKHDRNLPKIIIENE